MMRRAFAGALAAAVAAPALRAGDDDFDARLERVTIQLENIEAVIEFVLFGFERPQRLDLRQPVPAFGERSWATTLQRPTLAQRLRGAPPVADVVLHERRLVLLPTAPVPTLPRRTVVAHRRTSWEVSAGFREVAGRNLPGLPELRRLPVLGRAFLTAAEARPRTELVVLVRPILVPSPES